MTSTSRFAFLLLIASMMFSCQQQEHAKNFTVKNSLALERKQETIAIPVSEVKDLIDRFGIEGLQISAAEGGETLLSQPIDGDGDGKVDEILFQADIPANGERKFIIAGVEGASAQQPKSEKTTFSRFVPERIDDYAWENDRVAFRTYGPEAQRITESGQPGGTLTSGIDAWLKRVPYPVIDKWYAKHQEQPGAYHIDTGEGYDPYHVGDSRGVGGIGVWENDTLWVSKNFTGYKTLAIGPIRTIFELDYAPWQANGRSIREKKRISLDLGSNLSKFEVLLQSDEALPNAAIGLTLHEGAGKVNANPQQGWFRYWEPMDDSELGVGLVVPPDQVKEHLERRVEQKDQSHLLVLTEPKNERIIYYAGFGWKKSGQFNSAQEWDQYLAEFAQRIASPLKVEF